MSAEDGDPLADNEDVDQVERLFARTLESLDDALVAGRIDSTSRALESVPPDLDSALRGGFECLQLLEQVWPRNPSDLDERPFRELEESNHLLNQTGHLGRFRIIRRLGQGGGGIVFLAEDPLLSRRVALKLPRPEALANPELRCRFLREGLAVAALDHPHIVPVFEAGEIGPICYLASAYCEGMTLADWLAKRAQPDLPRSVALLVATISEAVEHAHQRGVLHRDIKPSNIMLVPKPKTEVTGQALDQAYIPRLTDFGLAKLLDGPRDETRAGVVLGTPSYMAPEQAEGRAHDLGPKTDVYALGALLYELLTDRPPFQADSDLGTLRLITSEEPVSPRLLRPATPRDLEVLCLKCLEKDPKRRYAGARELAEDLRRFLAGEPIRARPVGFAGKLWRWGRRNPALAAATAAAVILLVTVAIGATTAAIQLGAMAHRERGLRASEAAARRDLEGRLYLHHIAQAQHEWRANNPAGFERHLAACPPERRGWEWFYLRRLRRGATLTLRGHTDVVYSVAFSPNGRSVASTGDGGDGTIRLWDSATGRESAVLHGHAGRISCAAFSPDGAHIASAGADRAITFWDLAAGRELFSLRGHTEPVHRLAFSPDGARVASASSDQTARIWDRSTGREVLVLRGHGAAVTDVTFHPESDLIATAGEDGAVKLWDASSGRETLSLNNHDGRVHGVAFSPDGSSIASGGEGQAIWIQDTTSGTVRGVLRGHAGLITGLSFSADGSRIASANEDGDVKIWDVLTGRGLRTLTGHTDDVRSVAFSPDGRLVASCGVDETVKLWDVTRGQECSLLHGHAKAITDVAISPDGSRIVSASRDDTARVWDAISGRDVLTLKGHSQTVHGVAYSPDGTRIASASGDGTVKLWDAGTGRELRSFDADAGSATSVAYGPGGRVASAFHDGKVHVWDAGTGHEVLILNGNEDPAQAVAISPDGSRIASAGEDGLVRCWDATTGRAILTFAGHSGTIRDLKFSPDGRRLASAGFDRSVRVWDLDTGQPVLILRGHTGYVTEIAFSPDASRIASTGWDGTVRVWDAGTGQLAIALGERAGRLRGVAFSPDGRWLVTGSSDTSLQIWDASPPNAPRPPVSEPARRSPRANPRDSSLDPG